MQARDATLWPAGRPPPTPLCANYCPALGRSGLNALTIPKFLKFLDIDSVTRFVEGRDESKITLIKFGSSIGEREATKTKVQKPTKFSRKKKKNFKQASRTERHREPWDSST